MLENIVRSRRQARIVLSALLVAFVASTSASAQYFGRNKVQYKDLDFEIMKTEHFDIYFYPSAREGIDIAARMAERWHARLERILDHELRGRQPLVLYAAHPDFEQTNTIGGEIGEGTGGVTESLRRRIILPLAGPLTDTDHVIGHELVHAFQFDITSQTGGAPGETGAHHLPLWFIEGMAEYLSIGPIDPHTTMWMRDAARQEQLPGIDDLNNPRYFPYRWGHAFWAYVAGKWGDDVIRQMLAVGGAAGDYRVAIEKVLGTTSKELSAEWHEALRRAYQPVLSTATLPSSVGRVVLRGEGGLGGDLNVGPALSPDGKWITFLSERSILSIDLFLADAATGEVRRKLTSTATDPHYSSLQFIYSAGAWDAESRRIAIATISGGRPALVVFAAESGNKVQEIKLEELDEIFNPTWSPDGTALAFTGMTRGLTDLYVYDLGASALRQLTRDAFAELQPAWSPDGRRIAFATDRFSSRLETLDIGSYRLAVIDPASGRVEPVGAFTSGKNINPQWAPDSQSIYFISDRDGISNVYRVTLSGDVRQVTNIATGISGITASSPALTVAARAGTIAFSVYDDGNYHVHALDAAAGSGTAPGPTDNARANATLPPLDRKPGTVATVLADASLGLPPSDAAYEITDYNPSLSLEAVSQPMIAFGADRFGAAVGGGIAFMFSDMLGDQNLTTVLNVSSGIGGEFNFKNTTAQVAYINQKNRWNWGVIGGQVPYLSGGVQAFFGDVNGEPAIVQQTILFRQTDRSASALLAYPFSRAHRIEFQGGGSQISFDQIVQTQAVSRITGQLLLDQVDEQQAGDTISLGTSSAALVYDTSAFGATSPVSGQRYRLEVAPTFGDVQFTSVLTDYRRYFMPVPFYTFAGRVLHYGRYGSGGGDERLFPLFVGYPNLVRGYDVGSFDADECSPGPSGDCETFDRLIGSRVLVGNFEFRFPLLRPFGASQNMYGPLPVEVALFADAGIAFNNLDEPSFFGGDRTGVSSVGVALRANFFGYAVGEFDFSRPLQRPGKGWVFQFNLAPGF
jgi:Tol biopolymer transport system component